MMFNKRAQDPANLAMRVNTHEAAYAHLKGVQAQHRVAPAPMAKLSKGTIALALALNSMVAIGIGYSLYDHYSHLPADDAPTPHILEAPSEIILSDEALQPDSDFIVPEDAAQNDTAHVVPEIILEVPADVETQIDIVSIIEDNQNVDDEPRALYDEDGRVLVSIVPKPRPENLVPVVPQDTLLLFERDNEARAVGCGAQPKFDEFWVQGLEHTPVFQEFLTDYAQRMQFPMSIDEDSSFAHRRALQLLLGLNECYSQYNSDTYDGALGSQTRAAIGAFQEANGLEVTGQANNDTLQYLMHASAMRTLFNMYVLDYTAKLFNLETQGVFQLAWHESMYIHTAVSSTGADGIGQMINSTFLAELTRQEHPFVSEYQATLDGGSHLSSQANELFAANQYDIWTGSYAMLSHCDRLLDIFNAENCASVYGAYQLGIGGYRQLRNAAEKTPSRRAGRVVAGTNANGYGNMTARNALNHVNGLIDSASDRERAVKDVQFLQQIVDARIGIIESLPSNNFVLATRSPDTLSQN